VSFDGEPQAVPENEGVGVHHAARLADGWQRRFVAEPSRVVEMVRLYQDLGYETAVDPVEAQNMRAGQAGGEPAEEPAEERPDPGCDTCRLVTLRWLHVIYTRTPRPRPD